MRIFHNRLASPGLARSVLRALTRHSAVAGAMLVVSGFPGAVINAQEETVSHRPLGNGVPGFNVSDSQRELLRRLQQLREPLQEAATDPRTTEALDPAARRSLEQALQTLRQQQPSSGTPPSSGPRRRPDAGRQPNDPGNVRSSESDRSGNTRAEPDGGTPPDSRQRGGRSIPGSESSQDGRAARSSDADSSEDAGSKPSILERLGLTPEKSGRSKGGTAEPGGESGQATGESGQAIGKSGQAIGKSRQATGESGGSSEHGPAASRSGPKQRPRFREGAPPVQPDDSHRFFSEGDRSPAASDSGSGRASRSPSVDGNTEPNSGTGGDNSNGSWFDSLKSLFGQGQSEESHQNRTEEAVEPGSGASPATPSDPIAGGRNGNRAGRHQFAPDERARRSLSGPIEQESEGRTATDGTATESSDPFGLLSLFRDDDKPASSPDGADSNSAAESGFGAGETARSGSARNRNRATGESAALQDRSGERLDEIRGSSKSFQEKLAEIAKLARSESQQDRRTSGDDGDVAQPSAPGGLQSVFVDALADATKGLAEQLQDLSADERLRLTDRLGRRSERDQAGGAFDRIGSFGERANDWFVGVAEPAFEQDRSTRPVGGHSRNLDGGELPAGRFLLAGVLLAIAGWFLYSRQRGGDGSTDAARRLSETPGSLQSREDVVRAFHDLAARCPAVSADWWTHDRAAEALAATTPQADADVRLLAEVYELARYLPEDAQLTDEQLSVARAAWLRCRKS